MEKVRREKMQVREKVGKSHSQPLTRVLAERMGRKKTQVQKKTTDLNNNFLKCKL